MIRISIRNACLLLLALFINQLALCQSNNEWFLGKWTNGENTIVLTKTTFVDSEGDVYPVKYEYHPESGSSIDFLDTDSNEYTGSGGELLGYDVTLDDKNQVIILSEHWHGAWEEQYSKMIPENVNAESKSSPEKGRQLVLEVAIEEGVERIDSNMFPSLLESIKEDLLKEGGLIIKNGSIEGTPAGYVFSFTLENELKQIPDEFLSGTPLLRIELPDGIEHIGEAAFSDCALLKSIVLPNSVKTIGNNAFGGCSSLTSIVIPNSVTTIDDAAFYDCSNLADVIIPNSVTTIGDVVFCNCTSLTSIVIPNSVTTMGEGAFKSCTSLTSIVLSNSMTEIGGFVFEGCTSLTSIVIPNSVTWVDMFAFADCTNLTSIVIPNSETTIFAGAFAGCHNLTEIILSSDNVNYSFDGSFLINKRGNLLFFSSKNKNVVIPNSVTEIDSYAFKGCTSLTSVVIPNSVTRISGSAFEGCTGLTSVTIPNTLKRIANNAFKGCTSLTSVTIPNSEITIEEDAFPQTTKIIRK